MFSYPFVSLILDIRSSDINGDGPSSQLSEQARELKFRKLYWAAAAIAFVGARI